MVPTPILRACLAGVLAVIAMAVAEPARSAACPPVEQAPTVILNTLPGRVTYSRQHDIQGLAALRRDNGRGVTGRGAAVGLTRAQLGFGMEIQALVRPDSAGGLCGYIRSVKARLGYDTISVYLARDYPVSSCAYRVIREHEDRHVAIYRENLAEFAQAMRARLVTEATRMGPVRADDADAEKATREMQERLWARLKPIIEDMQRSANRNQRAIDTPASYAAEQSRCTDW